MKSALKSIYTAMLVHRISFDSFEPGPINFYKSSLKSVLKDMGVEIVRKAKTK